MKDLPLDDEAVIAAVDLVNRSGGSGFEIGYVYDEDDAEYAEQGPCWYASAEFSRGEIKVERFPRPDDAATALAVRVLTGGRCRCGKLVALEDTGALFVSATFVDGSHWSPPQAVRAGQCRWKRQGQRWEPGCDVPSIPMSKRF